MLGQKRGAVWQGQRSGVWKNVPLKRRVGGGLPAWHAAARFTRARRAAAAVPTGELKFHDVDLDDAVVASAGTITPTVNIIPQDVTDKTRIGRKCTIKSIGWRYKISLPEVNGAATPTAGDVCRVIMYLDKQANGLTAAVSGVTGLLASANFQSFNNLSNKSRFRVLHDATYALNYETLASHGFAADTFDQAQTHINGSFFKGVTIPLEFDDVAATGALTTIRSNNIGVLLISATGVCGFDSKIRLRFSDN